MSETRASETDARLREHTRMECRICWYVYDPAEGDEQEQIEPGTPFRGLPDYWRCPQCDAEPNAFLPMDD
jgi:rubredoxin